METYQAQLEEEWKRFRLAQEDLDEHGEGDITLEDQILDSYMSLGARLKELILAEQPSISSTFDGKFEQWSAFYNTFISTIDNNHCLTLLQKFHYLRASITGEAANCVSPLCFKEENYPKVLNLLKQRYDCPRRIVSCHSLAIINYPKLTKCSPTALRDLINVVRQNIDALNSLGEVTNANCLILNIIGKKLPDHVRQQWELTLPNKEVPQYTI